MCVSDGQARSQHLDFRGEWRWPSLRSIKGDFHSLRVFLFNLCVTWSYFKYKNVFLFFFWSKEHDASIKSLVPLCCGSVRYTVNLLEWDAECDNLHKPTNLVRRKFFYLQENFVDTKFKIKEMSVWRSHMSVHIFEYKQLEFWPASYFRKSLPEIKKTIDFCLILIVFFTFEPIWSKI